MSPPRSKSVRLRDVAAVAGVSVSTASRVLHGGKPVGPALQQKVRTVAEELGYIPNLSARALRGRRQLLAILADELGGDALAELTAAVVETASQRELVTLVSSGGDAPFSALRALRSMRPRAMILTGSWVHFPETRSQVESEIDDYINVDGGRVVIMGAPIGQYPAVGFDDREAGRAMGHHGASCGASSVMILAGPKSRRGYLERLEGFLAGLEEAGVDRVRVVHCGIKRPEAAAALGAALDAGGIPDLLLCVNDQTAAGAYDELERRALRIPDDIAVSGVDDLEVALDLTPPLTTFRQPFHAAAEEAVLLVLEEGKERPRRVELRGSIVVRESTCPD